MVSACYARVRSRSVPRSPKRDEQLDFGPHEVRQQPDTCAPRVPIGGQPDMRGNGPFVDPHPGRDASCEGDFDRGLGVEEPDAFTGELAPVESDPQLRDLSVAIQVEVGDLLDFRDFVASLLEALSHRVEVRSTHLEDDLAAHPADGLFDVVFVRLREVEVDPSDLVNHNRIAPSGDDCPWSTSSRPTSIGCSRRWTARRRRRQGSSISIGAPCIGGWSAEATVASRASWAVGHGSSVVASQSGGAVTGLHWEGWASSQTA